MKTSIIKITNKKITEPEVINLRRHNYWTNRRRHSFSSSRVRIL